MRPSSISDAPSSLANSSTQFQANPMRRLGLTLLLTALVPLLSLPAGCGGGDAKAKDQTASQDETTAQDETAAQDETVGQDGDSKETSDSQEDAHVASGPNHLADETSPYLLMHVNNPVDWYPWNEEALAKAKRENKPIFLSIGYSSCHWCHVMERESFLDKEIAAILNEHFVCIKVDREERPDIDNIYMRSLYVYQALSNGRQGGGWPLSMFLTPDALPFFGGTYFPARDGDRGAAMGFLTIVDKISQAWGESNEAIAGDAKVIADATRRELLGITPDPDFKLDASLAERAFLSLKSQFDTQYGGFGFSVTDPRRPKFPEPSNLLFLLDMARTPPDEAMGKEALDMVTVSLDLMAMGGIRDHLGGGFHRYSVDRYWHIPHFEKMLYDNGQLASAYAEAYELTGDESYRRIVAEMMTWLIREMKTEEGGFYSALDADSEDEEGKFYRWDPAEVKELLDDDEYETFAAVYGLDEPANFEGHYALLFNRPFSDIAEQREIDPLALEHQLKPLRDRLLEKRAERERPLTDTKILTGWNGLMIRGLADAGRIFAEPTYVEHAAQAADMVLENLRTEDGRLLRTYSDGEAKLNGYLVDYAFLIDGLIALHQATSEDRWLKEADALMQKQLELFWDDTSGGFFFTSTDHESLLARAKNPVDQAQPAGSSVSAQNLLYLAEQLEKPEYREQAQKTMTSVSGMLDRSPGSSPRMLIAVRRLLTTEAE